MIIVAVLWHFFYLLIRFRFVRFYPKPKCHGNISKSSWKRAGRACAWLTRRDSRRAIVIFPFSTWLDKIRWRSFIYIVLCSVRAIPRSLPIPKSERSIELAAYSRGSTKGSVVVGRISFSEIMHANSSVRCCWNIDNQDVID